MGQERFQRVDMPMFNSYLIQCDVGYLLIDTSYEKDYQKFIQALDKLGVKTSDIKYILLTHHHDDHVGLASQLVEESGAAIVAHEKGIDLLKGGENEPVTEPLNRRVSLFFSLLKMVNRSSGFPPVVIEDKDIIINGDDYDFLRSLGIEGKILCTPGHTKDSISVILDDGNAFVGDAAMSSPAIAGIKYRPIFVENMVEVFTSWRRILEEGPKTIYPFHGKPFSAKRLNNYLEQHKIA
jgi:glyoxylase-like metal-dependent hydrolase (beta-lactamase superfamily II)